MGEVKQINIRNRTCYFYNNNINLNIFVSNLSKIDRKDYKGINIYYIGYITIKKIDDYESIYSVNPLYLVLIMQVDILKKKNGNKYFIFGSTDEKKEALKKYTDVWMELKIKSKQQMMVKKMIMKKITRKLNLILTMTCY